MAVVPLHIISMDVRDKIYIGGLFGIAISANVTRSILVDRLATIDLRALFVVEVGFVILWALVWLIGRSKTRLPAWLVILSLVIVAFSPVFWLLSPGRCLLLETCYS